MRQRNNIAGWKAICSSNFEGEEAGHPGTTCASSLPLADRPQAPSRAALSHGGCSPASWKTGEVCSDIGARCRNAECRDATMELAHPERVRGVLSNPSRNSIYGRCGSSRRHLFRVECMSVGLKERET